MLPFFRKIRYKLAENNQFFKYSRYAIGEIVLVVIGILIALSINNWNQERINEKEIKNKLMLVQRELIGDIAALEKEISFRGNRQKLISRSLKILEEETSLSSQNRAILDSAFLTYGRMDPLFNNMRSYEAFLLKESSLIDEEVYIELNNYIDFYNKTNARIELFRSKMTQPEYNILINSSVKRKRSGEFEYSFSTIQKEYQLYESLRQGMSFFGNMTHAYSRTLDRAIKVENKITID